jgi:hypothetical protein
MPRGTGPSPTGPDGGRVRRSRAAVALAGLLVVIPLVALAGVPWYSRTTPELWGFPFFYWYQFLWILLTPILTYAAYRLVDGRRGRR